MAIGWMRLDHNFWQDDKFLAVLDECGEAGAWRVVVLYNLAAQKHGRLCMTDPNVRRWVEHNVGMKGRRLDDFIEKAVGCGCFDREWWEATGILSSHRLAEEGERAKATAEKRAAAGAKSGEARRRKSEQKNECETNA